MRIFSTRTRVRYAETDAAGIAYYNSFFIYFEVGRIELFRELGLAYDWHLPIVETHCRYRASARFDDPIEIDSCVEEVRTRAFRIGCKVYRRDPDGARVLLAEGYTAMAYQDDARVVGPMPEAFRRALVEAAA